jgi:hypothetical protein
VFSQWFHFADQPYYARWDKGPEKGEVDLVYLSPSTQRPEWAVEVKWSDRYCEKPAELAGVIAFCRKNHLRQLRVTSKSVTKTVVHQGVTIEFGPVALYCCTVGFNLIANQRLLRSLPTEEPTEEAAVGVTHQSAANKN